MLCDTQALASGTNWVEMEGEDYFSFVGETLLMGRRPADALQATARVGMVVMLTDDLGHGSTAVIERMTADRCHVRTEDGERYSLDWPCVCLMHVRPDPSQLSPE